MEEFSVSMCDECKAIDGAKRGTPAHGKLVKTGSDSYKPAMLSRVAITRYECSDCGTKWEYQDDRNDPWMGWTALK